MGLTITGYQDIAEPEGATLVHRGYASGIFQRSFTISTEVDRAKISARLTQGVLELALPKAEQAKPRKIAVTAGA